VTYVGPNAALAEYCNQEISPQLNQAVTNLLQQVKGYQERAMAKNAVKVSTLMLKLRMIYWLEKSTKWTCWELPAPDSASAS
jgi:hypothetical protein